MICLGSYNSIYLICLQPCVHAGLVVAVPRVARQAPLVGSCFEIAHMCEEAALAVVAAAWFRRSRAPSAPVVAVE